MQDELGVVKAGVSECERAQLLALLEETNVAGSCACVGTIGLLIIC